MHHQMAKSKWIFMKYCHTGLLFLSAILLLCLLLVGLGFAEPACLLVCLAPLSHVTVQHQKTIGERSKVRLLPSAVTGVALESGSSYTDTRRSSRLLDKTPAGNTGETLKLKYQHYYIGIDQSIPIPSLVSIIDIWIDLPTYSPQAWKINSNVCQTMDNQIEM